VDVFFLKHGVYTLINTLTYLLTYLLTRRVTFQLTRGRHATVSCLQDPTRDWSIRLETRDDTSSRGRPCASGDVYVLQTAEFDSISAICVSCRRKVLTTPSE